MYVKFEAEIEKLNQRVEQQARERSGARLLMTHPGAGPITALATDVFLGDPARFANSKELASYVGMIPGEYSSGKRQRLGGLTKQGNPLLRFLWSEAAIHAVRRDPEELEARRGTSRRAAGDLHELLLVLRDWLTGFGIEDQQISLIALGVLSEIEHLGDGIGDGVKGALPDAFAPEPVVFDEAKHRSLIGDGMIHKVGPGPGRYDQEWLAGAIAATAKGM